MVAVENVDFDVAPGEFLGIVGESGCGKSTLLFAVARLLQPAGGDHVRDGQFHGDNLVTMSEKALNVLRWRDMSVVMQSAMNALNPVASIGAQFRDADARTRQEVQARDGRAIGRGAQAGRHRPDSSAELSAPTQRRHATAGHDCDGVALHARAGDHGRPTSALDVVAQRSLMVQIKQLQQQLGFAVVFVTHDMSLVEPLLRPTAGDVRRSDRRAGPTRAVFDEPAHPYSTGLLDAFPSICGPRIELTGIPGRPPDLRQSSVRLPVPSALPGRDAAVLSVDAGALSRRQRPTRGA